MNFFFGQLVGAVIAIGVLSALLRLLFKQFFSGPQLALTTCGIAVLIATFAYAYGKANGGPPQFGAGLVQYGIGGTVVLVIWLIAGKRKTEADG